MALHAVEDIERAFGVTREFLTPIEVRRWLKLAVIAFFVGGGVSLPSAQFNASTPSEEVPVSELPDSFQSAFSGILPADPLLVVAVLVGAAVLLGALFAFVGAVMEFVLIESLRTGEVSIRRRWRRRWRQGLRLFGFRVAIGLPMLALVLGWLALLFVPLLTGRDLAVPFVAFLVGIPVLFVVGVVYGLVSGFTTTLVVPLMIRFDSGVLAAWRRLWGSIRAAWKQYLAYAVISFLLTVVVGLVASIAVGLVAVLLAVPFVVVAGIVHFSVSFSSTVGFVALVGLVVVFGLLMLAVWVLAQVPVVTYLRYYALLVLGDVEESFDLVSEWRETEDGNARAAVRDEGSPEDDG
ncbi:hypothetical protein SAMN04488066_101121 [Halorubrum aquaticum]|uniref:Uncharacterized protein n=1 Tax=Halorubrum aquaticum TaxID=387340 RepID=A0A1I2Z236_9EURY|nr:hypothetical protein [Halorubrum aquaticum]SFH31526.1 hypothetical protein SAMN04488066_101121 [Halorubrum aquaticum]